MVTWVVGPTFTGKTTNKQTSQVAPFAKKRSEQETGEPFVNGFDIYGSGEIYYSNFSTKEKQKEHVMSHFFFTQSVHLHFKHLLEKKEKKRRKKERERKKEKRKKARGLALFTGGSLVCPSARNSGCSTPLPTSSQKGQ